MDLDHGAAQLLLDAAQGEEDGAEVAHVETIVPGLDVEVAAGHPAEEVALVLDDPAQDGLALPQGGAHGAQFVLALEVNRDAQVAFAEANQGFLDLGGGNGDVADDLGDEGHHDDQGQDHDSDDDDGGDEEGPLLVLDGLILCGVEGVIQLGGDITHGVKTGGTLILHHLDGFGGTAGVDGGQDVGGAGAPSLGGGEVLVKVIVLQGIDAAQGGQVLLQFPQGFLDNGLHGNVIRVGGDQQDVTEIPGRDVGVQAAVFDDGASLDLGIDDATVGSPLGVHQDQGGADDDDGNQDRDTEPQQQT